MSYDEAANGDHRPTVSRWSNGRSGLGTSSPTTVRPAPDKGNGLVLLLLAVATLHALGGVSLVPVMSALHQHFANSPRIDLLIPLAIGAYALSAVVFCPIVGSIVNHRTKRGLLIGGLIAYALSGTAPLWTVSLEQLVVSRILLGMAGAAIFTTTLAILCDLRQGQQYARVIVGMSVLVNVAASFFLTLAGYLGEHDWRATSWLFLLPLFLAALLAIALRRSRWNAIDLPDRFRLTRQPIRWRMVVPTIVITLFGTMVFYAPTVGSSELLSKSGMTSPSTLGIVSAFSIVATAIGSLVYAGLTLTRPTIPLATSSLGITVGFLILVNSGRFDGMAAGVVAVVGLTVASVGCGLLLSAMIYWCTGGLTYHDRGRVIGLMYSSFYLGIFLDPVASRAFSPNFGGILTFFGAMAGLSFLLGVGTGVTAWTSARRERNGFKQPTTHPGHHALHADRTFR